MSRDQALSRIDDYFNNGEFEAELARRIAFKTESNLAGCEAALQAYLDDELVPCLQILALTVKSFQIHALMQARFWSRGASKAMICQRL